MSTCGDYGGETTKNEPCKRDAGWQTGLSGGRCRDHQEYRCPFLPDAPEKLDFEARWFWYQMAPLLYKEGYLKQHDLPFFEQLCEVYGLARNAYITVQEEGRVIDDPSHGGKKRHPDMLNYKQMADKFEKMAGKMGMNVNARMAISIDDDDERKSQMAEVLEVESCSE